ncbi:hypothetical protein ILUMI_14326, partial [Ignelater luminosus]
MSFRDMTNEEFDRMFDFPVTSRYALPYNDEIEFQETPDGFSFRLPIPEEKPGPRKRKKRNKRQRARQAASQEVIPETATEDPADSPAPVPPQLARMESRPSSAASSRSYAEVVQQQVSDARSRTSSIMSVRSMEAEPTADDNFEEVTKVECMNHVIKNYGKSLYRIKQDTKSVSLEARKLLDEDVIAELVKAVQSAIYANTQNVDNLKPDIRNSLYHVYGNHV